VLQVPYDNENKDDGTQLMSSKNVIFQELCKVTELSVERAFNIMSDGVPVFYKLNFEDYMDMNKNEIWGFIPEETKCFNEKDDDGKSVKPGKKEPIGRQHVIDMDVFKEIDVTATEIFTWKNDSKVYYKSRFILFLLFQLYIICACV